MFLINFRKYLSSLLVSLCIGVSVSFNVFANDQLSKVPNGAYKLDLSHASVVWKVNHLGYSTYVGRFNDFQATLDLDTADFTNSKVAVTIQVDSIATAFPWTDKENFDEKLSQQWFKSADHPTIEFESSSVSEIKGGRTTINGELTLMGETLPVSLEATLNKAAPNPFTKVPTIGFSATTSIDRTKWGLSNFAPNIGAQVQIEIEGEFNIDESK